MTLTHELACIDPALDDFDRRLDKAIADGFELLRDLTGPASEAFNGLYLGWYGEVSGLIRQLAPLRVAEFNRLYRSDKRRRLDYETYVIEDYLLGVSLHGGFGNLDAMRAITARRFHFQLLLLKSLKPEMRRGLEDLRREISRDAVKELLLCAKSAAESGKADLAVQLSATALQLHMKATFLRHELKTPLNPVLSAMGKVLVKQGIIEDQWLAMIEMIDEVSRCPVVLPAEVSETLSNTTKLVDQVK